MEATGYKSHVETSRTNRYSSLYHDWFMIGVGCFTYFLVGLSLTLVYVLCEMDYFMLSGLFRIQRFFSDDAYYFSKQVVLMYGVIGFIFTLVIGPIGKMSCTLWSWILTLAYLVFGTYSYLFGFTQYGKLLIRSISIISLITHILMCNFIFFLFDPMTNATKPTETNSQDKNSKKAKKNENAKKDEKPNTDNPTYKANLDKRTNRSKHLNAIGPYGSLVYYRVIMFLVGFFLGSPVVLFMLRVSLSVDTFSEKDPIMSSVDMCRIMMLMFSISIMASIFLTLTFSNAQVTDYTLMPFRMISFRRLKKTMFNFFDIELLVVVWIINPLIMTLIPYTTRIHSEFHKFTLLHRFLFSLFLISIMILMHRDILYSCIKTIKLLNASIFNILYTDGCTQIEDNDLRKTPVSTTPYSNYTPGYYADSVSMVPHEITVPSEVSYPYFDNGWDHIENEDKNLILRSYQIHQSLERLSHYINTGGDMHIHNIYSDLELSLCKQQIDISDESETNPNDPMKSIVYLLNEYRNELMSMIGNSFVGYNNHHSSVISNIKYYLCFLVFSINLNKLFLIGSYGSVCSIISYSSSIVENLKLILLMTHNLYYIHGLSSFFNFVDNLISNIQYIEYLIQNSKLFISVLENFISIDSYIKQLRYVRCLMCKLKSLQSDLNGNQLKFIITNLKCFIKISCFLNCNRCDIEKVKCFICHPIKLLCFVNKFKSIKFDEYIKCIDCLIQNLCFLSDINIITLYFISKCTVIVKYNICILEYIKCNIMNLQRIYTKINLIQILMTVTANLQTHVTIIGSFEDVESIVNDLRDIHCIILDLESFLIKIACTQTPDSFICNLKTMECIVQRLISVYYKIDNIRTKIQNIDRQMKTSNELNSIIKECIKSLFINLKYINLIIQYLQAIESLVNNLNYSLYMIQNLQYFLTSIIKMVSFILFINSSKKIESMIKELDELDQIIKCKDLTKSVSSCFECYQSILDILKCTIDQVSSNGSTISKIVRISLSIFSAFVCGILNCLKTVFMKLQCRDDFFQCLEQIKCILHCLKCLKGVKQKLQCICSFIINLSIIDDLIRGVLITQYIPISLSSLNCKTGLLAYIYPITRDILNIVFNTTDLGFGMILINSLQTLKKFVNEFQDLSSIINSIGSEISIFNNIQYIKEIMSSLEFIETYTRTLNYYNKYNIKYLKLSIESVGILFLHCSSYSTSMNLFELTDLIIGDDSHNTLSDQSMRPNIVLQTVSRLSKHLNNFIWVTLSHNHLEECRFVVSKSYTLFKISEKILVMLKTADNCCCVCCYKSKNKRYNCKNGNGSENTINCVDSIKKLLQDSKTTGLNPHTLLLYDITVKDQATHPCLCLVIKYSLKPCFMISKCYIRDILFDFFNTSRREFNKRTYSTRQSMDMAKFIFLMIGFIDKILISIGKRYLCSCDKTCCTDKNNNCRCCNDIKVPCCSCNKPNGECNCCCKQKNICQQPCCTLTTGGSSCLCCRCCCMCFCRCPDDQYYPYFISMILYLSHLLEDVFTFDNEKIQMATQYLTNLISELDMMNLKKYSPMPQWIISYQLPKNFKGFEFTSTDITTLLISKNNSTLSLTVLSRFQRTLIKNSTKCYYKTTTLIPNVVFSTPCFRLFYQGFSDLTHGLIKIKDAQIRTKSQTKLSLTIVSSKYLDAILNKGKDRAQICTGNKCSCCKIICNSVCLISDEISIISYQVLSTLMIWIIIKSNKLLKSNKVLLYILNDSMDCNKDLIIYSRNSRICDSTSSMIYGDDFDHINPKYFGYDDVYRPHPHFGSGYFKFVLSRVFIVIILLFMFIFIRTRFDRFVKPDIFGAYLIKVDSNINRFREVLHNRLGHSIRNIGRIGSLNSLFDDMPDPSHHLVFEYPELADIHDLRSWSESDSISDTFTDAIYDEQSRTVKESRRRKVAFYIVIVVFSLLSSLYLNFVVRDLSVMLNLDHNTWSYFISITILMGMIISLVVKYCVHLYDFFYVLEKYSNRLTKIESFVDDSFGGITGNLSYTSKFIILFQLLRSLRTDIVSLFSMNYPYHIPAQSLMKNKVYPYKDMTTNMERMMTCENIECIRSMVLETIGTPESMDLQNILDFISYAAIRNTSEFDKYHGYFSGNERYLAWRLGKLLSHNFFLLTYGRYSCILEMDHIIRNLQVPITQFHNCQMLWQLFGNYESNLISLKCLSEESIGVPLTAIQRDVLRNKFNEEYIVEFTKYQEFIMRNLHINTEESDDEECSCYFPYPDLIKCPLDREKVSRLTREYFGDTRRLSLSLPTTNCNVTKQISKTDESPAVSVTKFCDHWLNMRLGYCHTEECEKAVRFAYDLIVSKLSSDSDIFESIKETVDGMKLNILNTEEVYVTPQDIHLPIKSSEHKSLKDYTNKLNELRYKTSDNYHDTVLDYLNRYMMETVTNTEKIMVPLGIFLSWYGIPICEEHIRNMGKFQYLI